MFPNFNAWHKVPKDATIPAGTPYWRYDPEDDTGRYLGRGVDYDAGPEERWPDDDYYTEERVLDPEEEVIKNRARNMYYLMGGIGWEHEDTDTRETWLNLAAKYAEK